MPAARQPSVGSAWLTLAACVQVIAGGPVGRAGRFRPSLIGRCHSRAARHGKAPKQSMPRAATPAFACVPGGFGGWFTAVAAPAFLHRFLTAGPGYGRVHRVARQELPKREILWWDALQ